MIYRIQVGGPVWTPRGVGGIRWYTQEIAFSRRWALHRMARIAEALGLQGQPISLRVIDPLGREVWSADPPPAAGVATVDPDLIPF